MTTFAVVAGVAGAELSAAVVLILGACNLVADGFSMAVSNFLGLRAEREQREVARREEERHVRLVPEGEREEVRQIFAAKGFEGEQLESVVETVTSDHELWIATMMREELGFSGDAPDPWRSGAATMVAFVCVGALPLLPYLADLVLIEGGLPGAFGWSVAMTAIAFAVTGAAKAHVVGTRPWRGALEVLAVGGAAATLAYAVGVLLRGVA